MPNLPLQLTRTLLSRTNATGLLAVTICGAATLAVTPAAALADDGPSFWTQFAPSQDTRLIFVSSSEGNDSNSGLNPNEPVKSLDRAYDLLRDGYPDWMLLKRGDVWYDSMPGPTKSGRSESERLVIGAYGDDPNRPQIRTQGNDKGMQALGTNPLSHIAYVGLHFEPANRTAQDSPHGIRWLAACDDILFEDLYIDGYANNLTIQAHPATNELKNITLNGCVVVNAWNTNGHSQGLFAQGTDGLTIQNSVFDRNGFNHDMGAEPTIFNHNIYLQGLNDNVVVTQNMLSDASSHGVHFRAGGELTGNLFLLNPISIDLGGGPGSSARQGGVEYNVENNLVMYGRGINESLPRSWGISAKNTKEGLIKGNILANAEASQYNVFALRLADPADGTVGVGFHDLTIEENYFVGWPGSMLFIAPRPDQPYSNVQVHNNHVYRDLDVRNAPLSDLRWQQTSSEIDISSNKYYVVNPTNSPFKHANQFLSYDQWSDINEPDSSMEVVNNFSRLEIEDFMNQAGHNGDVRDYIEIMRSMSRQNPLPELHPSEAYDWARDRVQRMN